MPKRNVSMADIARHVGLSRSTVSFVINGRTDIAIPDGTRRRVLSAVRELGYRRNAPAQALASSRTNLIGLITDISTGGFAGGVVEGAQREAWNSDKLLLIVASDGDPKLADAALETLLEQRIEGLVYATQTHRAVTVPSLASEVATVLVHCTDPAHRFPHVIPDEVQGGYLATRRLIDAGHERIGLINLDGELPAAAGRLRGYRKALREAGLRTFASLVGNGHATAEGGYEQAARLLRMRIPPTGLFCATDRMAMGAYDAIKELGLRIPDDIGVVGFDNQEVIASFLRPGLTTVGLPFDAMGAAAVQMLAESAGRTRARSRVLATPLVERGSA